LAIEEIRPNDNKTSFILRPLASSADRSSANAALVATYQPVANLSKIRLYLNWSSPTVREKDLNESQSSNTDSLPSNHDDDTQPEDGELKASGTGKLVGPYPTHVS
jgi:hypothetical protein